MRAGGTGRGAGVAAFGGAGVSVGGAAGGESMPCGSSAASVSWTGAGVPDSSAVDVRDSTAAGGVAL